MTMGTYFTPRHSVHIYLCSCLVLVSCKREPPQHPNETMVALEVTRELTERWERKTKRSQLPPVTFGFVPEKPVPTIFAEVPESIDPNVIIDLTANVLRQRHFQQVDLYFVRNRAAGNVVRVTQETMSTRRDGSQNEETGKGDGDLLPEN
jgi:hypothetical protein